MLGVKRRRERVHLEDWQLQQCHRHLHQHHWIIHLQLQLWVLWWWCHMHRFQRVCWAKWRWWLQCVCHLHQHSWILLLCLQLWIFWQWGQLHRYISHFLHKEFISNVLFFLLPFSLHRREWMQQLYVELCHSRDVYQHYWELLLHLQHWVWWKWNCVCGCQWMSWPRQRQQLCPTGHLH